MNKNLEQAEYTTINEGKGSDTATLYEGASIPYVPVPEVSSLDQHIAETPSSPRLEPVTPHVEMNGGTILVGIVLGATVGALLALLVNADLLTWACIGAFAGGVIAFPIYMSIQYQGGRFRPWS